jgi:ribosome-binding protein aMBF1 (putative translation factor)
MNAANRTPDLATKLRRAREARCISPLALSLRVRVLQRHVSVVEGGRVRPSRKLFAGMRRNVIGAEEGACAWM